jgi:lipopolysaccharide transport system ATP-binding protein
MPDVAVRAENLGKQYRIGERPVPYRTLRETVAMALRMPWQSSVSRSLAARGQELWALQDVSFEVRRGEVLGLIGPNGAGKSTLLKVLGRVTEPTVGRAEVWGRVGSMLDVGVGFHPELSGRENVYLNGAILGMRRTEVQRRFAEIIDFAGLDAFVDTPVKHYSSGMYMRLAFAVAAHLDTEVLFIDEVLAIGDASFQKKCLGTMTRVAGEGRTIIFVSHNMPPILALCHRALRLEHGRIMEEGAPRDIVRRYLDQQLASAIEPLEERRDRSGDGSARITSIRIENGDGDPVITSRSRVKFTIGYRSEGPLLRPQFVVTVLDELDIGLFVLHNEFVGGLGETLPAEGYVTCLTDPINLTPGRCAVHVELLRGNVRADFVPHASSFEVGIDDVYGTGMIMPTRNWALCVLGQKWWLHES